MQIDINVKTYSTKQRILAFFTAFMIFTMTCPEILDGLGVGLIVHAVTNSYGVDQSTTPQISTTSKTSNIMGFSGHTTAHGDNCADGTYTGRVKPVSVSMYDYMTDKEITNNTSNAYNLSGDVDDAYTFWNRYNPYNTFDTAISGMDSPSGTVIHEHDGNITIKLTTTSFAPGDVYVYLWTGSGSSKKETPWPGKKMTFDSADNCYVFTFNRTDSNSDYYLDFTPTKLIFNNGSDSDKMQTQTINQAMSLDKTYEYNEGGSSYNNITYIFTNSNSWNSSNGMCVHYWLDASNGTNWPGVSMSSSGGQYVYTLDLSTINYVPERFIINNNNGGSQTSDLPYSNDNVKTHKGFTYNVYKDSGASDFTVEQYPTNLSLVSSTDPAEDITFPMSKLYLGNFLARRSLNPTGDPHSNTNTNGKDSNSASDYNDSNESKGYMSPSSDGNTAASRYDDFYWQARMNAVPGPSGTAQKRRRRQERSILTSKKDSSVRKWYPMIRWLPRAAWPYAGKRA